MPTIRKTSLKTGIKKVSIFVTDGDDADANEYSMLVKFRIPEAKELKKVEDGLILGDDDPERKGDADIVRAYVIGWSKSEILEDDDTPVEFSQENLEWACEFVALRGAMVRAFLDVCRGAKTKN